MKKRAIIFIIGLITVTSCIQDDILDKKPLDIITEDIVWSDQTMIDAYLTNAYMKTHIFDNENPHHISSSGPHFTVYMVDGVSDECRFTHTWSGNANKFKNGGLKIGGGLLEWWEDSYEVIRVLNEFIQRVPEAPLENDFKKDRVAEARFLRAFNYFAMVKRYGGVPLITLPQKIDDPKEALYPERAKEQAIYDFILAECEEIINDLPETRPSSDYGRPTKYAALALKSKAALYAGSIAKFATVRLDGVVGIDPSLANNYYKIAYDSAKEIIESGQYSLYNKFPNDKVKNFRMAFMDENANPEKIFVKPHNSVSADVGGGGWNYDWSQCPTPNGWSQGNTGGPYLEMVESFEYVDGTPGKLNRNALESGLWTTEELWANKDPRFYATIYTMNTPWQGRLLDNHNGILKPDGSITHQSYAGLLPEGISEMDTGFGVLKFLDESKNNLSNFVSSKQDWTIFRYGAVLLNYAEAAFNLGKIGDAKDAVNQIRERAGIALLNSIDREKIRHERKVELAFEGERYWDLRRWRTAVEVLSINRSGLQYILDPETGKFKLNIIEHIDGKVGGPAFYPKNYYFPITLERTGKNPNLIENPGY